MDIDRRILLAHGARAAAALATGSLFGRGAFAADEVKIGWIQPTTGALASSFGPLYLAADMALEEINAAGGILGRKLVKVTADDEGSPAKEPIVTRRLIDDGCKFILGPVGSSQAMCHRAAHESGQAAFYASRIGLSHVHEVRTWSSVAPYRNGDSKNPSRNSSNASLASI